MGKNYSDNFSFHQKYRRSHNETDVSTYLRNWYPKNQTRSMEWVQLAGKILHWSIYLWLVVKKSSISRTQRFTYFQILCYALERWTRTHNQIMHGKTGWCGSKSSSEYRALDTIDGEPVLFEWNTFPGFTTLQLVREVQQLLSRLSVEPANFTGRIIFMSMFNDISWGYKENEKECESSAQLVSLSMRKCFHQDNGHSSDLDQKRIGILLTNTIHKENGTELRSKWW